MKLKPWMAEVIRWVAVVAILGCLLVTFGGNPVAAAAANA